MPIILAAGELSAEGRVVGVSAAATVAAPVVRMKSLRVVGVFMCPGIAMLNERLLENSTDLRREVNTELAYRNFRQGAVRFQS
jgi:hypothetical protein